MEIKNAWIYTSTPRVFMAWQLTNLRIFARGTLQRRINACSLSFSFPVPLCTRATCNLNYNNQIVESGSSPVLGSMLCRLEGSAIKYVTSEEVEIRFLQTVSLIAIPPLFHAHLRRCNRLKHATHFYTGVKLMAFCVSSVVLQQAGVRSLRHTTQA